MRSMRTSVQLSLILQMCTSRHVFNCSAVDRPTGFQCRPALHCPKMFILKPTKQLVLLVLLDLNGVILLHHLLQVLLLAHLPTDGADWLRLIHHRIPEIRTTKGTKLEALARSHRLLHVLKAQGSQSR